MPPGVFTSAISPTLFPINDLATGELTEIKPFSTFVSSTPTILNVISEFEFSSNKLIVAPKIILSDFIKLGFITSALLSLSSISKIRPYIKDCCSFAA